MPTSYMKFLSYFYSRASYEARLWIYPVRKRWIRISTHAPHTRRDLDRLYWDAGGHNFYSRASYEARLAKGDVYMILPKYFYSRASYEARRPLWPLPFPTIHNFYSRASYEARHDWINQAKRDANFYSRASYEARHVLSLFLGS